MTTAAANTITFGVSVIIWTPLQGPGFMPDADTNVLLGLSNGHTCEGFFDGEVWRDVTGWVIEGEDGDVVAWADLPACKVAA